MKVSKLSSVTVERKTFTGEKFAYNVEVTKEDGLPKRIVAVSIQKVDPEPNEPQYYGNINFDGMNFLISLTSLLTAEDRIMIHSEFEEIVTGTLAE